MLGIFKRATGFQDNIAIISGEMSFNYRTLLTHSRTVSCHLLAGKKDLRGSRVAFMVNPGFDYVKIQWGIWAAGGIAVPLNPGNPFPAVKYVLDDSQTTIIVVSPEYHSLFANYVQKSKIELITTREFIEKEGSLPDVNNDREAMILYTSGTTGSPKGVVTTHANIQAQITALVEAWEWTSKDHILNVLPLHHVHGIINVVSCALWSGAICQFLPKFSPQDIFTIFNQQKVNMFMAVPTIYYKLISYWETLSETEQKDISRSLARMRVMVSGSAALPISVMDKWKKISNHDLLERYGMTEIGMAISNPYHGKRRPGYIGQALPGVMVRLVGEESLEVQMGEQGEIQVKGSNVFKEYWNMPESTAKSFSDDGWFKTGDIAIYDGNSYKILGRSSVDIIKSGGYKISALEIEEVLRTFPGIKDCGVVGIPDEEWGEVICAGLVSTTTGEKPDISHLKDWISKKLPNYKIPRQYIVLEDLPRNAMGKVTKNELKKLF